MDGTDDDISLALLQNRLPFVIQNTIFQIRYTDFFLIIIISLKYMEVYGIRAKIVRKKVGVCVQLRGNIHTRIKMYGFVFPNFSFTFERSVFEVTRIDKQKLPKIFYLTDVYNIIRTYIISFPIFSLYIRCITCIVL